MPAMRSPSGISVAVSPASPTQDVMPVPTVTVVAPGDLDEGEVDLGKVAQGLLAGLKGGDDLLASFREARKTVNASMKLEETTSEDPPRSPDSTEPPSPPSMSASPTEESSISKEEGQH